MMQCYKVFISIILLGSFLQIRGTSEDRLSGALIGAALGDAIARVTTPLDMQYAIDYRYGTEGLSSFGELCDDDFIIDGAGKKVAPYGCNTLLSMSALQVYIKSFDEGSSVDCAAQEIAQKIVSVYDESLESRDLHFAKRYHPSVNTRKALILKTRLKDHNAAPVGAQPFLRADFAGDDKELQDEADSGLLCIAWPLALVYAEQTSLACTYGDTITSMTHRHPTARAATAALITGLTLLLSGSSGNDAVEQMVKAAEKFDRLERRIKKNSRKIWSRRNFSAEQIAQDEMLTSDMIRYAIYAAQNNVPADEILGFMSKRQDNKRSYRGFLLGYQADEAVAAAIYLFVKHAKDFKALLKEGSRSGGNAAVITSLAGALAGAQEGYNSLAQQGFSQECAHLENSPHFFEVAKQVSQGYQGASTRKQEDRVSALQNSITQIEDKRTASLEAVIVDLQGAASDEKIFETLLRVRSSQHPLPFHKSRSTDVQLDVPKFRDEEKVLRKSEKNDDQGWFADEHSSNRLMQEEEIKVLERVRSQKECAENCPQEEGSYLVSIQKGVDEKVVPCVAEAPLRSPSSMAQSQKTSVKGAQKYSDEELSNVYQRMFTPQIQPAEIQATYTQKVENAARIGMQRPEKNMSSSLVQEPEEETREVCSTHTGLMRAIVGFGCIALCGYALYLAVQ